MRQTIKVRLLLLILTLPVYAIAQTKSLKDYFYSSRSKRSDTLLYRIKNDNKIFFKRIVAFPNPDTIVISDFSALNTFLRSYTFAITDTTITTLSSKTNLNEAEVINNDIRYKTWLTIQHKEGYYDSHCVDTSNEDADSYWEWEYRHQTGFRFDTIIYKNSKVPVLVVFYDNYLLNQPTRLSAKIYHKEYTEKMVFARGVGLISITQNGIDKQRSSIIATSLSHTNKNQKDFFSNYIELLDY